MPDKCKEQDKTKYIDKNDLRNLFIQDENIHDLCDFELTGNSFGINYEGNTAASFWMNVLKWGIPVVVLI